MKCRVRLMAKNLRFRMLTIEGQNYILDMGGTSLWKMLFPFFYWLFPSRVYKMDNPDLAEELAANPVERQKGSSSFAWLIGIPLILGNLLSPLLTYLDVDIPSYVSATIMAVMFILLFLFIFHLNKRLKEKLLQKVDYKACQKGHLWLAPVVFKSVFLSVFMYFCFMFFVVFGIAAYIEYGNWFILLLTTVSLLVGLVMPSLVTIIGGHTHAKFLGGRHSVIHPHNEI